MFRSHFWMDSKYLSHRGSSLNPRPIRCLDVSQVIFTSKPMDAWDDDIFQTIAEVHKLAAGSYITARCFCLGIPDFALRKRARTIWRYDWLGLCRNNGAVICHVRHKRERAVRGVIDVALLATLSQS